MIVEDDIARVRDRTDIVQVISEHTSLRRVGRRWQGLCPFHAEKTPSFSVNAEQGLYFCFGCKARGDVITFVREVDHVDFVTAVERLAARVGVPLTYTDPAEGEDRRRRAVLYGALDRAATWFHEQLADDAGSDARSYLTGRGINGDLIDRFQVGWAPSGGDDLDLPGPVRKAAGLAVTDDRGNTRAMFRGRVMFPIRDPAGRTVGFGGRLLPGAAGPKYKNSPDGRLYHKSRVLYGLDLAKAAAVKNNRVVVCEGYTDVIGLAGIGIPEAVATCGTALTEDHVRALTAYTRRIVLAFDADDAGQGAAAKVYGWERELDVEFHVVSLPAGMDPADLARTDPDGMRSAVEGAQPLLGWRLDRLLADVEGTPEARARAADIAVKLVRDHPDRLVRDQYLTIVADRLHLDRRRLAGGPGRAHRPVPVVGERPSGAQVEALRLLLDRPATMTPLLHGVLFSGRAREVWDAFEAQGCSWAQMDAVLDRLSGETEEWLYEVLAEGSEDSDPDDVVELLLRGLVGRWLAEGRVPADRVGEVKLLLEDLSVARERLDRWVRAHAVGLDQPASME